MNVGVMNVIAGQLPIFVEDVSRYERLDILEEYFHFAIHS